MSNQQHIVDTRATRRALHARIARAAEGRPTLNANDIAELIIFSLALAALVYAAVAGTVN